MDIMAGGFGRGRISVERSRLANLTKVKQKSNRIARWYRYSKPTSTQSQYVTIAVTAMIQNFFKQIFV